MRLKEAVWSTAFINTLPDSAFLHVEPGGKKDADGKTVPRGLRHFPVYDAHGNLDMAHLRNALARIPQANLPDSVKAACTKRAQKLLAGSKESVEMHHLVSFREAVITPGTDGGPARVAVRILETDTLGKNRRIYPSSVMREAHHLYEGAKVFLDHSTKAQDAQRPEGSIRDLCGYLENVQPDMSAELVIISHQDEVVPWIQESIRTGKDLIGLSHDIYGTNRIVRHTDGKPAKLVESVDIVRRVDLVTAQAAGGTFKQLLEAEGGELTLNLEELKEAYPELFEQMREQITAEVNETLKPEDKGQMDKMREEVTKEFGKLTEAIKERDDRIAKLLDEQAAGRREALITAALTESKLPDYAHDRIREVFDGKEFESDDKLTEALEAAIKSEREYLSKATEAGKPRGLGAHKQEPGGEAAEIKEAREFLEDLMGVKEEEEKGGDK